jgi:hypothetical protein
VAPRPAVQAVVRGGGSHQLRAACPRLFRDILAVLTGLRPAFMLDYGMLPPECLAAAVADLARALRLAEAAAQLCVAVLGDCCYLVHPRLLPSLAGALSGAGGEQMRQQQEQVQAQQHVQAQQQQGEPPLAAAPAVMFVAFDGQRVRWAAGADAREAAARLQALRQGLLQAVHEVQQRQSEERELRSHISNRAGSGSGTSGSIPLLDAEGIPGWREGLVPPTASGYLLGYPAIYLCHSLEGAQAASRCLSSGGLCLHWATCQLRATAGVPQLEGQQPLLAFSVPAELAAAPEWEACRSAWHARLQQQHSRAVKHYGLPWGELQMAARGAGPCPVAL